MDIRTARRIADNPQGFWTREEEREAFARLDKARTDYSKPAHIRHADYTRAQMIWDRVTPESVPWDLGLWAAPDS